MERFLPLYEGRFGHQFEHRFAEQPRGVTRLIPPDERSPDRRVEPQYWVPEKDAAARFARWAKARPVALAGLRRVARNNDERTAICTVLPPDAGFSYGFLLLFDPTPEQMLGLAAIFNSFVFDYLLRSSLSQPSLPLSTVYQVPVVSPVAFARSREVITIAFQLVGDATEFRALHTHFAEKPLDSSAQERRGQLRVVLDALILHTYKISRDDASYILDTFPIVRRKDLAAHGEFRTKRLILEAYDRLATSSH